ncbi:MAG: hypothetical protein IJP48_02955 [Synergistaceae bacterium]|nr:hypothetical protein [Synergistaceae bacterium]
MSKSPPVKIFCNMLSYERSINRMHITCQVTNTITNTRNLHEDKSRPL